MDPDRDEVDVFSDTEEPQTTEAGEDEEDGGEGEEEEEEEDEEEDARIFNTWMQLYRRKEIATGEEDGGGEAEGGRAESRGTMEPPVHMRADRRASLPCPVRKHNLRAIKTSRSATCRLESQGISLFMSYYILLSFTICIHLI